jgi:hypothetical protein
MLIVISPAKALDFSKIKHAQTTQPVFQEKAEGLVQKLKKKSPGSLKKLFNVSPDLAQLNYDRFQNWNHNSIDDRGKPAIYAFNGHVYQKIDSKTLSQDDLAYANKHLRILSGMYGLLRPSDIILPHRLEMGTKWPVTKRNLYGYWSKNVTKELNKAMQELNTNSLINLASNEYFKVVDKKSLNGHVININFMEMRPSGKYETIGIFAKQARGSMSRFIFQNKLQDVDELRAFNSDGYTFNWELSKNDTLVFTRR